MKKTLLPRPGSKARPVTAFIAAGTIHLAAIALASLHHQPTATAPAGFTTIEVDPSTEALQHHPQTTFHCSLPKILQSRQNLATRNRSPMLFENRNRLFRFGRKSKRDQEQSKILALWLSARRDPIRIVLSLLASPLNGPESAGPVRWRRWN